VLDAQTADLPHIRPVLRLEDNMAALLRNFGAERTAEEVYALAVFWGAISLAFFSDSGILDSDKLLSAFRGTMELPADRASVYSLTGLFTGVLTEAIRLGKSCVSLASALLAPDLTQPDRVAAVADWRMRFYSHRSGRRNSRRLSSMGSGQFC
jgi:hypothetical protein